MGSPRLLTVDETAGLLRTSPATVRRYVHDGKLRASRPGGRLLIHQDSIDELLSATEVEPVIKGPVHRRTGVRRPPSEPLPPRDPADAQLSYRERARRAREAGR